MKRTQPAVSSQIAAEMRKRNASKARRSLAAIRAHKKRNATPTASGDLETFIVQVCIVKEITVSASDDLQAEREAFQHATADDRENIIAMKVMEAKDGGGALESEDNRDNWRWARENMNAMDRSWVS